MIDRQARDRAAVVLEEFRSGRLTNFEFENAWGRLKTTDDRAIRAIGSMIWHYYDDAVEHRLTGERALGSDAQDLFHRCINFLRTEYEYEWPVDNLATIERLPKGIDALTLGVLSRWLKTRNADRAQQMTQAGDIRAWPFMRS